MRLLKGQRQLIATADSGLRSFTIVPALLLLLACFANAAPTLPGSFLDFVFIVVMNAHPE
ncbi:hypothetical protein PILCRDRAFT_811812 [Piloderma croceum F 1598]|uniref:Uncharacterized protein n=1 Tax=Piloderma croceum (strain F 1598) TaxID=765440 RepID=A0A0C3CKB4_PILCF|nr:hypothetical protein PILCRDRAFT_811812 [Piloderma croceum F 1598]